MPPLRMASISAMPMPCDEREEEPLLLRSVSKNRANSFMSKEEYLQTIASRVLYSRSCGAFYMSLLAASLTEIIWIAHPWVSQVHCCRLSYPRSRLFFAVEAYLTVGLAGETTLRILWMRAAFWRQCGNIFDAIVSALSLLSFALYLDDLSQDLELVVLVVMGSWIALRIMRLLAVARSLHSQRRKSQEDLEVNFTAAASSIFASDGITDEESAGIVSRPSLLELSVQARTRETCSSGLGSPGSEDGQDHEPFDRGYTLTAVPIHHELHHERV
mmetsp:Transcript_14982/g.34324  ORF Transcript_14982/g.34324 Transcript_14982/m.34324 type:complete len:273 (-) Transcript_14982:64-882(-)